MILVCGPTQVPRWLRSMTPCMQPSYVVHHPHHLMPYPAPVPSHPLTPPLPPTSSSRLQALLVIQLVGRGWWWGSSGVWPLLHCPNTQHQLPLPSVHPARSASAQPRPTNPWREQQQAAPAASQHGS